MIIEMILSGFLFLFILWSFFASVAFGIKLGVDFDADDRLQKINNDPKKFKISILIALIEYVRVIALAVMLFIAFSPFNLILGIVWTTIRIGEGLICIYSEIDHWGLINIAREYSGSSGAKKNSLSDLARTILQTKNSRFEFAQFLFSIGTLAYSIVFVISEVVPPIIGWLGIVASILTGFGSGIKLIKPNFKVVLAIGVLLLILFEVIIGGWLIFSSFI